MVNISRDQSIIPHQIKRALAGSSLLFVGYSLSDMDFRVLFRSLIMSTEASLRRLNITVQLDPNDGTAASIQQREYLEKYFNKINMHVYWGTAREFTEELHSRWKRFSNDA
jgi:hypothetical protein